MGNIFHKTVLILRILALVVIINIYHLVQLTRLKVLLRIGCKDVFQIIGQFFK